MYCAMVIPFSKKYDAISNFSVGRNRKLQGLANVMAKLWETCAIAKIAIKRGVANTCNDRMAEELKVCFVIIPQLVAAEVMSGCLVIRTGKELLLLVLTEIIH